MLKADESEPCPAGMDRSLCKAGLIPVGELSATGDPVDSIISEAFTREKEEGFPRDMLVDVVVDDIIYTSHTRVFGLDGLDWIILVVE